MPQVDVDIPDHDGAHLRVIGVVLVDVGHSGGQRFRTRRRLFYNERIFFQTWASAPAPWVVASPNVYYYLYLLMK